MNIGVMRVAVPQGNMRMQVAVFGVCVPARFMPVLMVFIMAVFVFMRQFLMEMLMFMVLGEVQPHAQTHQRRGNPECH